MLRKDHGMEVYRTGKLESCRLRCLRDVRKSGHPWWDVRKSAPRRWEIVSSNQDWLLSFVCVHTYVCLFTVSCHCIHSCASEVHWPLTVLLYLKMWKQNDSASYLCILERYANRWTLFFTQSSIFFLPKVNPEY